MQKALEFAAHLARAVELFRDHAAKREQKQEFRALVGIVKDGAVTMQVSEGELRINDTVVPGAQFADLIGRLLAHGVEQVVFPRETPVSHMFELIKALSDEPGGREDLRTRVRSSGAHRLDITVRGAQVPRESQRGMDALGTEGLLRGEPMAEFMSVHVAGAGGVVQEPTVEADADKALPGAGHAQVGPSVYDPMHTDEPAPVPPALVEEPAAPAPAAPEPEVQPEPEVTREPEPPPAPAAAAPEPPVPEPPPAPAPQPGPEPAPPPVAETPKPAESAPPSIPLPPPPFERRDAEEPAAPAEPARAERAAEPAGAAPPPPPESAPSAAPAPPPPAAPPPPPAPQEAPAKPPRTTPVLAPELEGITRGPVIAQDVREGDLPSNQPQIAQEAASATFAPAVARSKEAREILYQLAENPLGEGVSGMLSALSRQVEAESRNGNWELVLGIMAGMAVIEQSIADDQGRRTYGIALKRMMTRSILREVGNLALVPLHQDPVVIVLQRAGADGVEVLMDLLIAARTSSERHAVFNALSQMKEGTEQLVKLLNDPRWFVVRNAAELIGEMQIEAAVPDLGRRLDHDDERVRKAVALALAKIGTSPTVEHLRRALRDRVPAVRIQAALGLGRRATAVAMSVVVTLDEETDPEVQRELTLALGRIGSADAVQALIKMAQPSGKLFRRKPAAKRLAAVEALRLAGTPAAIGTLQGLANDSDKQVRAGAQAALHGIRAREERASTAVPPPAAE